MSVVRRASPMVAGSGERIIQVGQSAQVVGKLRDPKGDVAQRPEAGGVTAVRSLLLACLGEIGQRSASENNQRQLTGPKFEGKDENLAGTSARGNECRRKRRRAGSANAMQKSARARDERDVVGNDALVEPLTTSMLRDPVLRYPPPNSLHFGRT